MRSMPRTVLLRLSIPLLALPGLPGCVGAPPIVAASNACSTLLPDDWRAIVPGAPLPAASGAVIADWIGFADAQTGQLDKANGRTRDAIAIVERCEARDRAAVARAGRRKFLNLF